MNAIKRLSNTSSARPREVLIALLLVCIGIISRALLTSRYLYHWDSINFAFALSDFDVASGQPHIPGYLLYVWFMRLVDLPLGDPQLSMVATSVLASALAMAQLFRVGTLMFDEGTGIWAALFLGSSPLFWFYGEIALPHALDTLFILISIELLFRLDRGKNRLAVPTAIWLGIVGGFRPQTEVFLIPLALYASRNLSWRERILSALGLVIANLAWLVPLLALSGGISAYIDTFSHFYTSFNTTTSIVSGGGFRGILRNVRKLVMYTLYGWGFSLLAVPGFILYALPSLFRKNWREIDSSWIFIGFWIVPGVLYYVFIHMGQQGLVFVFLPALLLATAWMLSRIHFKNSLARSAIAASLVLGNSLVFLFAPSFPFGSDGIKILTVDTIRSHDAEVQERVEAVQAQFEPADSILIASDWRWLQYYLPEYSFQPYQVTPRGEEGAGLPEISGSIRLGCDRAERTIDGCTVVIFDSTLNSWVKQAERFGKLDLASGDSMLFLHLDPTGSILLSPSGIDLNEEG